MKTISTKEMKEVLRVSCNNLSQVDAANKFGISQQYLSLMLSGTRIVSKKIALMLGYKREVVFIKSENSEE